MERMSREIIISARGEKTRVAILENGVLVEYYIENQEVQRTAGNIYKGRVCDVLPGMQAAFIDIGLERNAYLHVSDACPPDALIADLSSDSPQCIQRIERLLKPGDEVIVQVIKEPAGTKGARVSRRITLAGRFLVLIPGADKVAVSHRITSQAERERLRELASAVRPNGFGFIVRTAAEGQSREHLEQEAAALLSAWNEIVERAKVVKAPTTLHRDPSLVFSVLKDTLSQDVSEIIVDSVEAKTEVLSILKENAPEFFDRVVVHPFKEPSLFEAKGVESQLRRSLARRVWLRTGAYIVIDHAEALTVIDVNTGRFTGTKDLGDTIFKTNIEAAREVARQIRLRDVGGIIVVDFIDMTNPAQQQAVLSVLQDEVVKDRTKTSILGVTRSGLVEVIRNKKRQGLMETLGRLCPTCDGAGWLFDRSE